MPDEKRLRPGGRGNTINDAIRCRVMKQDGERCKNYSTHGECSSHQKARLRAFREADRSVENRLILQTQ